MMMPPLSIKETFERASYADMGERGENWRKIGWFNKPGFADEIMVWRGKSQKISRAMADVGQRNITLLNHPPKKYLTDIK